MPDFIESTEPKQKSLEKLGDLKAAVICQRFELTAEATLLTTEELTPVQLYALLLQGKLYTDAVNFLAHGLPKREAIWWAYLCAEKTEGLDDASKEIKKALQAIKEWVYQPNEKARRAIEKMAESLKFKNATSWTAIAAFWSGGSITPKDTPEVMPNEYLSAKAVAGAVMLAAALNNPEQVEKNYAYFLAQGADIASGGNGSNI